MINKLIFGIILLVLQVAISTNAETYVLTLEDVVFNENNGYITDYHNQSEANIEIPGSFKVDGQEVKVKGIVEEAFSYHSLSSVIIANGISDIQKGAFAWNKLESVSLPNSIVNIGDYAFYSNKLTFVTLPSSLKSIGANAFNYNLLESIVLPINPQYKEYGWISSNGREKLMGGDVITDFQADYHIPVPYTITINDVQFDETTGTISDLLNTEEKKIQIPEFFEVAGKNVAIKTIGRYAFSNKSLQSIIIPNGVTRIEEGALMYNLNCLITLPNSLIYIGEDVFLGTGEFNLPIHPDLNNYGWVDMYGSTYNGGDRIEGSTITFSYSIPGAYTISYFLNEGENSPANPIAFHIDEGVSAFAPATRVGYDFKGWFNAEGNEINMISSGTESNVVLFAKWDTSTNVDNVTKTLQIYPNPASNYFEVSGGEGEKLVIYSTKGVVIKSIHITRQIEQVDISNLISGIYLIKIDNQVKRLVVK